MKSLILVLAALLPTTGLAAPPDDAFALKHGAGFQLAFERLSDATISDDTIAVVKRRLALIGRPNGTVVRRGAAIVVTVPDADPGERGRVSTLMQRQGTLEFQPVVDAPMVDAFVRGPLKEWNGAGRPRIEGAFEPTRFDPNDKRTPYEKMLAGVKEPQRAVLRCADFERLGQALTALSMAGSDRFLMERQGDGWRSWAVGRDGLVVEPLPDAKVRTDQQGSRLELRLTEHDAKRLEALSARLVGRQLAIVVDGEVKTAPWVMEPISGGTALLALTGSTTEEGTVLAVAFRSPMKERLVDE